MHWREFAHCRRGLTRMLLAIGAVASIAQAQTTAQRTFIRINQLGYLPESPKIAILCSLDSVSIRSFSVQDLSGRIAGSPRRATSSGRFGPCSSTYRLDFSSLRSRGRYQIVAGGAVSPLVRIDPNVYAGAADTLLYYMRQQRSGFNPIVRDSVHKRDGIIVDHPVRTGEFVNVSGVDSNRLRYFSASVGRPASNCADGRRGCAASAPPRSLRV